MEKMWKYIKTTYPCTGRRDFAAISALLMDLLGYGWFVDVVFDFVRAHLSADSVDLDRVFDLIWLADFLFHLVWGQVVV